jgi:hypothetical protein
LVDFVDFGALLADYVVSLFVYVFCSYSFLIPAICLSYRRSSPCILPTAEIVPGFLPPIIATAEENSDFLRIIATAKDSLRFPRIKATAKDSLRFPPYQSNGRR